MSTPVWAADDDDEWEDEEEEEVPKKKAAPKKASKSSSGPSRIGLAVSFSGSNGGDGRTGAISFVYDMSGIELGLGVGINYFQNTPNVGDPPEAVKTVAIVPSFYYTLGKGLLAYGLGIDVGVILEPISERRPDGGTSAYVIPNFFTKAEIAPNVALKLAAGVKFDMPAPYSSDRADVDTGYKDMIIQFVTSGSVIFYFM
jgi:hypothetical protein